jgi:transposase-like protein
MIKASRHRLAEFWCKLMHPTPMWPSHGRYRCRTCRRDYVVPWESDLRKTASLQKTEVLLAASSPVLFRMAVSK